VKNGIVLPSHVYNEQRKALVAPAFASLEKTQTGGNKPKLLLILRLTDRYYYDSGRLQDRFDLEVIPDPENVKGTEQTLAYGTQYLFDQGCDTVTWMGDDALFNPFWIEALRSLIAEKPDALAWSVYRSAYTDVHKTLEENGDYARVSSICGHGFTVSKAEWERWGIRWQDGHWGSPYGDTLDMHHIYVRQGDRWTTRVSFVDHTGKDGVHCKPHIPEHAQDFQGV
jgi:hypothetical protein